MKKDKHNFLIVLASILVFAGILYLCLRDLLPDIVAIIESDNKEEAIEIFLQNQNSVRGFIYLALLQFIQVITIFFPAAAIHIAGGLVYGPLKSFVICHITFVVSNMLVFFMGRHHFTPIGNLISADNPNMKKVTGWINSNNPAYMCMLAYMVPGIPNGFVPFAAIKTNMTLRQFALSVYAGSFFQIFLMCFIGRWIVAGYYFLSVGLVIAAIILIVVLYFNKEKVLKFYYKHMKKERSF